MWVSDLGGPIDPGPLNPRAWRTEEAFKSLGCPSQNFRQLQRNRIPSGIALTSHTYFTHSSWNLSGAMAPDEIF